MPDVEGARAEKRRLSDEMVLERAEHGRRSGVRNDRSGRVGLDRAQPGQVLGRIAPEMIREGAARCEETAPMLEAEEAVRVIWGGAGVLRRHPAGWRQAEVVRRRRAGQAAQDLECLH